MILPPSNWPLVEDAISFPAQASSTPPFPYWVSVNDRMIRSNATRRGRQYELDEVRTGEYQVTLQNNDGLFSPLNTASPFSPRTVPYTAYRKRAQWPATVNLLTPNQATSGEATAVSSGTTTIDAPLAAGTLLTAAQMGSDYDASAQVVASGTAWQGTQVAQAAVPAHPTTGLNAFYAAGWSVYRLSAHSVTVHARCTTASTPQVAAVLQWVDVTGAVISSSVGSTVTLPASSTSWTTLTATGTAPAAAAGAIAGLRLLSSPASGFTLHTDGWQVEQATAPSPWVAPSTWYPMFTGWVERWPIGFEYNGNYTEVRLTVVDTFAILSQILLKPPFYGDVLALGPTFFYGLDEGQGAKYAVDLTHHRGPAPARNTPYGSGTLTFGNSISSTTPTDVDVPVGGFVGAGSQVITLDNSAGDPTSAVEAATFLDLFSAGAGWTATSPTVVTRFVGFRCEAIPAQARFVWSWRPGLWNSGVGYSLQIQAVTGHLFFVTGGPSLDCGFNICDGNWHFALCTVNITTGDVTLAVDGTNPRLTANMGAGQQQTMASDFLGIGAQLGANQFFLAFTGDLSTAGELPFAVTQLQANQLYYSWRTGWLSDASPARYLRILAWSGYTGASVVPTNPGCLDMGPASDIAGQGGSNRSIYAPFVGQDTLTSLQNVVTTENGVHFMAADGSIVFTSRNARYGVFPPMVIFGEQGSGGEIPYENLGFDYDVTRLANDAEITKFDDNSIFSGFNTTSQAQYGIRTLTRTINSHDPYECSDAASFFVYRYGDPDLRINSLQVRPSANPTVWAACLSLELGSRVRLMRRPPSHPVIQVDGFVEQLNWSLDDKGNAVLAVEVSPSTKLIFWQLSAMHTTLHTSITTGATSIVLDALATAATIPFSAYVPKGLVLRIDAGAAGWEEIAVSSITGGAPGYTTVTVTLAAGTARAHTAGCVVSEALPAAMGNQPTVYDANDVLGTTTIIGY